MLQCMLFISVTGITGTTDFHKGLCKLPEAQLMRSKQLLSEKHHLVTQTVSKKYEYQHTCKGLLCKTHTAETGSLHDDFLQMCSAHSAWSCPNWCEHCVTAPALHTQLLMLSSCHSSRSTILPLQCHAKVELFINFKVFT